MKPMSKQKFLYIALMAVRKYVRAELQVSITKQTYGYSADTLSIVILNAIALSTTLT